MNVGGRSGIPREVVEASICGIAHQAESELLRATALHGSFASAHEGYAVILEELDELWDEVKKGGTEPRSIPRMRKEAIQVAAMAMRFVLDVCDKGVTKGER